MKTAIIISLSPLLWWLAFGLLTVRDYKRRLRVREPRFEIPPEDIPPTPRWPSWRDCFARPNLFFLVPWVLAVRAVLFALIWPCFALHRIYFPQLYTKNGKANQPLAK